MVLQNVAVTDHGGLQKEPWVAADEGKLVGNARHDEADMYRLGQRQELKVSIVVAKAAYLRL